MGLAGNLGVWDQLGMDGQQAISEETFLSTFFMIVCFFCRIHKKSDYLSVGGGLMDD